MASLNKVVLIGHIVADPELKQTQSGVSVTTFQIGVTRRFARSGEPSTSDFFTIVAWRTTAEFVTKYFRKGNAICVCGSLQSRNWVQPDGTKRYTVEVVADEAYFVEKKTDSGRMDMGYEPTDGDIPNFEDVTSDSDLPF